jgi:transcription elongation factor Elf1
MMNFKCLLFGHSLKITESIGYNKKALECKNCGKQSSIWKQSVIEDALVYNNGNRFLPSGEKDKFAKGRKDE